RIEFIAKNAKIAKDRRKWNSPTIDFPFWQFLTISAILAIFRSVLSVFIRGEVLAFEEQQMSITRRVFLKNGALAIVGTSAIPSFLTRAVYAAETAAPGKKRLIVLFQRGAADGLNIVVPHGEQAYYGMRPSIAIPRQSVIDLDGFFGLHPSMTA